jgi:hypothetical protein
LVVLARGGVARMDGTQAESRGHGTITICKAWGAWHICQV